MVIFFFDLPYYFAYSRLSWVFTERIANVMSRYQLPNKMKSSTPKHNWSPPFNLPSSSSSSGGDGIIELWDPDCGRRIEGLAVVFLLSLSDSLSKHTTSYNVSVLLFLSFCFILKMKKYYFMKQYNSIIEHYLKKNYTLLCYYSCPGVFFLVGGPFTKRQSPYMSMSSGHACVLWLLYSLCCTLHPHGYSVTTNWQFFIALPFSPILPTSLPSGNHRNVVCV